MAPVADEDNSSIEFIAIDAAGPQTIVLEDNVTFNTKYIKTIGNLTINGNGHALSLGENFGYFTPFFVRGGSLTLQNMTLVIKGNIAEPSIFYNFTDVTLDNVTIQGSTTTPAVLCGPECLSLTIRNNVTIHSPGRRVQIVQGGQEAVLTINTNATLHIGPGVIFEADKTTLSMQDASSILLLDGCDFYSGSQDMTLAKGTIIFDHKVNLFTKKYGATGEDNPLKTLTFANGDNAITLTYLNGATVTLEGEVIN